MLRYALPDNDDEAERREESEVECRVESGAWSSRYKRYVKSEEEERKNNASKANKNN